MEVFIDSLRVKIFADLKMSFTESNCGTGSEDGGNCSGLESSMEDLEVSSQASSGIVVGGRYALFLTNFLEIIRSHTFLRRCVTMNISFSGRKYWL